jgi:hypothetical protein
VISAGGHAAAHAPVHALVPDPGVSLSNRYSVWLVASATIGPSAVLLTSIAGLAAVGAGAAVAGAGVLVAEDGATVVGVELCAVLGGGVWAYPLLHAASATTAAAKTAAVASARRAVTRRVGEFETCDMVSSWLATTEVRSGCASNPV